MLRRFKRYLRWRSSDAGFSTGIDQFESLIAKLLSIAMLIVIMMIVVNLVLFLMAELLTPSPKGFFVTTLRDIFGLFLSVLIALEILENITAYLKKHVVQVELVIVTSLIAVARKIIILDLDKISGLGLIGLAIAILALSVSYWIVRNVHR